MSTHIVGWGKLFVCLALLLCPGRAAADFTPVAGWEFHLFPSFVIAMATVRPTEEAQAAAEHDGTLGDSNGLFGLVVEAPANDTSATVKITGDALMEPSGCTVVLPEKGKRYTICPPIKYKYGALVRNKQSVPASVTFRLELAGKAPEEQTITITLRSINDCPRSVANDEGTTGIFFTFAAYVNEEHPLVDKITKEALRTGIVESFHGYSDDGPEEVLRQVFALWHVLSKRGVRYSDASATVAEAESIGSQHVRLLDESLDNAQANCVDGSVLFASLLRKIGLEPFLVLEPSHCYVGFFLDKDEEQPIALETTWLGMKSDPDDSREIELVPGIEDAPWTHADTWPMFAAAINTATNDLHENIDKFAASDNFDYQIISITVARKVGILPIPYTPGKEQ